jgi:hypothetical protein
MEGPFPFSQHFDTNYIPTSEELDELKALVAEGEAVIDGIDAEMVELERKKTTKAQYVRKLRALGTPIRRLPDDILLTIFFGSLDIANPWSTPHPTVVASQVCRRWRGLAIGTPLLWTKIEIRLSLRSIWGKVTPPAHLDVRPYLSLCRRSLQCFAQRARMLIQRSSGCPLHLKVHVYDDPRALPSVWAWSEMFEPLAEVMSDPTVRWKDINFTLGVVPHSSLSLHFLRILTASSVLGMRNATLRIQSSAPISEAAWNAMLPGGKIDLSSAHLRSLSVRMVFEDMRHVQTSWDELTDLTIGPTFTSSQFFSPDALNILRSTPNLIRCTIHLSSLESPEGPPLDSLTLAQLRTLTIMRRVPTRAFAEALRLPALTRLWTDGAAGVGEEREASALSLWIQRYGRRLKEFSIAHSSLTKPALRAVLDDLPNIESLKLRFNATEGPMAPMNIDFGFVANDANVLAYLVPSNARGCVCPKLRTLSLEFWTAGSVETANAIVDLVEKRRSVDRPSSIFWLERLEIRFIVRPRIDIFLDLKRRGVDTNGISTRTGPEVYTDGWP